MGYLISGPVGTRQDFFGRVLRRFDRDSLPEAPELSIQVCR